jgi:hypothetical protein
VAQWISAYRLVYTFVQLERSRIALYLTVLFYIQFGAFEVSRKAPPNHHPLAPCPLSNPSDALLLVPSSSTLLLMVSFQRLPSRLPLLKEITLTGYRRFLRRWIQLSAPSACKLILPCRPTDLMVDQNADRLVCFSQHVRLKPLSYQSCLLSNRLPFATDALPLRLLPLFVIRSYSPSTSSGLRKIQAAIAQVKETSPDTDFSIQCVCLFLFTSRLSVCLY